MVFQSALFHQLLTLKQSLLNSAETQVKNISCSIKKAKRRKIDFLDKICTTL